MEPSIESLCGMLLQAVAIALNEDKGPPRYWCVHLQQRWREETPGKAALMVWSVLVRNPRRKEPEAVLWVDHGGFSTREGEPHALTAAMALQQAIQQVRAQVQTEAAQLKTRHQVEADLMAEKLTKLSPHHLVGQGD